MELFAALAVGSVEHDTILRRTQQADRIVLYPTEMGNNNCLLTRQ